MDHQSTYHYQVMARAIALIDAADAPLSLDSLATEMQMSPAHFQRLFSQWVGVSPKRYQQYLALGHAKSLLRERHTTIETAGAIGLSGSSRLHDMFLKWESMSPGEFAKGGEGLIIRCGIFDSPFGEAIVMGTDKGICGIGFTADMGREASIGDLRRRWPKATFIQDAPFLAEWVNNALGGGGGVAQMHLIGAPFQLQVWEALLAVPTGHVTTYSDIAASIDRPKAVRAVGTAVGRNPVSWLIPCHRALRKSGELGGYHWGLPVKRALLAWEAARADSTL
jgi:AraC family transcriptional regulator, regulatory protein of adaptative response / methylated-DNA-[protein]-cysteine methyltransferase